MLYQLSYTPIKTHAFSSKQDIRYTTLHEKSSLFYTIKPKIFIFIQISYKKNKRAVFYPLFGKEFFKANRLELFFWKPETKA